MSVPVTRAAGARAVGRGEAVLDAPMGRVAVTGATGFIGSHLVAMLRSAAIPVVPLVRRKSGDDAAMVVDFAADDSITSALRGVDVVIHCVGHAHAHEERSSAAQDIHQVVNCDYALAAARGAVRAGARRFVLCSSVKAVGEPGSRCVDESFTAAPDTAYGRAKRAAEEGIARIAEESSLEVVVLRLAMVYGPGSRGNLERMLNLVKSGRFPPLPETQNKRSLVHVSDAADALRLAASHPAASGRTYFVAHPQPVSGRELFNAMRAAASLDAVHWSVPEWTLRVAGHAGDMLGMLIGRRFPLDSQAISRLLDSACYSPAAIQAELGWRPQFDIERGLSSLLERERKAVRP